MVKKKKTASSITMHSIEHTYSVQQLCLLFPRNAHFRARLIIFDAIQLVPFMHVPDTNCWLSSTCRTSARAASLAAAATTASGDLPFSLHSLSVCTLLLQRSIAISYSTMFVSTLLGPMSSIRCLGPVINRSWTNRDVYFSYAYAIFR